MRKIETAKPGDKIWLGETCYEILGNVRDHKNKIIRDQWEAQPCAWSDRIAALPDNIRKFVQKTEKIRLIFPLKVWNHDNQ